MRRGSVDERALCRKVHIHQDAVFVYPAGVRRKFLNLPREICTAVSNSGLRKLRGDPITVQKSAAGIVTARIRRRGERHPCVTRKTHAAKAQTVPMRIFVLG